MGEGRRDEREERERDIVLCHKTNSGDKLNI
jgi:hypothetical protein